MQGGKGISRIPTIDGDGCQVQRLDGSSVKAMVHQPQSGAW
jgi:hypothetical protein